MTETGEQEPDALHLIVHVETPPATTEDHEVLDQERQQGRAPEEMYVDMGYTSGPVLVHQASLGTRLVGSVAERSRWQQRGFAAQDCHEPPHECWGLAVTLTRTDDYSVGSQVPQ